MAKKRIGALIVFPGNQDLGEVIHGGIPWNGQVSNEMLMSIFWPKSPVHDGAAIIEGGQVTEVGVLLPLSHRQDLPSDYGTRHRAAAGLAEAADALVVVVSEERGSVNVAKDRSLTQMLDGEMLSRGPEKTSQNARNQPRPPARTGKAEAGSRRLCFVSDNGRDLVRLYPQPGYHHSPERTHRIRQQARKLRYSGRLRRRSRLQLVGSSALIKSLGPGQVGVRVDLSKAAEGRNTFTITKDDIILPPGVSLNKIQPAMIDVTLDIPATQGTPHPGGLDRPPA